MGWHLIKIMKLIVVLEIDPNDLAFEDGDDLKELVENHLESRADVCNVTVVEPDHECLEYIDDPDPICVAMNAQKIGAHITSIIKKD